MRSIRPEVVFVVVGPEDRARDDALDASDIAAARSLGNVVFSGHRDDVKDLYAGFDLYVFPPTARDFRARPWRPPPAGFRSSPPTSGMPPGGGRRRQRPVGAAA